MKRIFWAMLLTAVSLQANAWTVGGQIGYQHNKSEAMPQSATGNDEGHQDVFSFNPWTEYDLNDNWSVGSYLETAWSRTRNDGEKSSEFSFGIAPYVHYNVATFGKFTLGFEGCFRTYLADTDGKGRGRIDTFGIGFGIKPDISYALTEHWNLDMDLNFFELGINYARNNHTDAETFHAGFNGDGNNVFNTGTLTVGVSYVF
ncbi:MAG: outer membrane beta-barrel protein [Paludibacteraceae bacterium]|nr:outer membrane beta-barrel protein [Paludibacteraceae bacterium]